MKLLDAMKQGLISTAGRHRVGPAALLVIAVAGLFVNLGGLGLTNPDESRYSEAAREMLVSGDWVVPKLNGVPRVNKPPLTYWVLAASYRVFGLRAWAGRLVPALAATATVLLVVGWAAVGGETVAALLGGAVLASSLMFFAIARLTTTDMLLCFWFTGAVVFGLASLRGERSSWWTVPLFYLFAAGGTLTKGPVALILPGLIVLVSCARERRWREVRWGHVLGWVLLYVAVAAPWYLLLERRIPGAARAFFLAENLARFTKGVRHSGMPFYYYFAILLVGMLPWTTALPGALWTGVRAWSTNPRGAQAVEMRFLLRTATVWWALPFMFFNLSATKLAPYILPCFPAVSLLVGVTLTAQWTHTEARFTTTGAGAASKLHLQPGLNTPRRSGVR